MTVAAKVIKTPVQLYRHLIRRIRKLPVDVQGHYQHQVRQVYIYIYIYIYIYGSS